MRAGRVIGRADKLEIDLIRVECAAGIFRLIDVLTESVEVD
jgi:hypothetical protein